MKTYRDNIERSEDLAEIILALLFVGVMLLACGFVAALDVLAKFAGWW